MPLSAGQTLNNRYRIVKLLGQGGFGAVYRAWDTSLNVPCALKENLDASPAAQNQFNREASLLATLRQPNLPRVTDYFFISGQGQYLVMDYVEGRDLQEMLDEQGGPLPESQVLPWIKQVCDALTYLHAQTPPIIHRDVKPANIRITPAGDALLVDFGIAKVYDPLLKTTVGAQAVTPGFSPHEQYGKGSTDVRSDVYALGATIYVLLTGQEPPESVQRAVRDPLVPADRVTPRVSAHVNGAVQQSLEMDPDKRFQDVEEFKAALDAPPTRTVPWRWIGAVAGLTLIILVLLIALLGGRGEVEGSAPTQAALAPTASPEQVATPTVPATHITQATPITPLPEPTPLIYSVQKGDTCSEVAVAYGTTVDKIVSLNRLSSECDIQVDQKLLILAPRQPGDSPVLEPGPQLPVASSESKEDGMEMVFIPAGVFRMGSEEGTRGAEEDEIPQHWVALNAFWIDRIEVTNAMYAACVDAGVCQPPAEQTSTSRDLYYGVRAHEDYPVIHVTWEDAAAYCQWVGRRLPTEAEWEKAARGMDGRTYPWGEQNPGLKYLNFDQRIGDTTQSGQFPDGASPYGVLDMAGNVWEWVQDWYGKEYYLVSPSIDPWGPESGEYHVLRGGSWFSPASATRTAYRFFSAPDHEGETIGFRCVLPAVEPVGYLENTVFVLIRALHAGS